MMKKYNITYTSSKGFAFKVIILILAAYTIQNASIIWEASLSEKKYLNKTSPLSWQLQIPKRSPEVYFISAGRPRAGCDLLVNGKVQATTKSEILSHRSSLLLSSSFSLSNTKNTEILIDCTQQQGFAADFTHRPIVTSFFSGVLLHALRALTNIYLGPFTSLLLLCVTMFGVASTFKKKGVGEHSDSTEITTGLLATFSVISFFYSLSLSHITRLFIPSEEASILHILLRNLFAMSFYLLGFNSVKYAKIFFVAIFGSCFFLFSFLLFDKKLFFTLYNYQIIYFSIVSILFGVFATKQSLASGTTSTLRTLSIVWGITQLYDAAVLTWGNGDHLSPAMLAILTISIAKMTATSRLKKEKLESIQKQILSITSANKALSETLIEIAKLLYDNTHYERASLFVDAILLGLNDHPFKQFVRVWDEGYKSGSSPVQEVHFASGDGKKIQVATETASTLLQRGISDQAWYQIVPIGRHICINLSDSTPVSSHIVYDSGDTIHKLLPLVNALNEKIAIEASRTSFGLQKLRSKLGDGKWNRTFGAIFADINSYSLSSENYGVPYSEFVRKVFFPALARYVQAYASPEYFRGDEIYLVCISELTSLGDSVPNLTLNTIRLIHHFIHNEGAILCTQNGYQPIRMSIGANIGEGIINCDNYDVETSGQIVVEAKRMLEAAATGQYLIKATAIEGARSIKWISLGEKTPILIKKNFLFAIPLIIHEQNVREAT